MTPSELINTTVAVPPQVFFGSNPDDVFGFQEEADLVGQVQVGFVVRRGGKENALAGVARDVVADNGPATAVAIPEVVAFVENDDAVTAEFRKDALHLGSRDNLGNEPVAV